jgi:ribonuclease Z
MIKLTFLGTSGSAPTKKRGLPSVALEYDGGLYLFDCGEGTQRQMLLYDVNPSDLNAIFISHVHGDHVIGIAGLLRTMALNRRTRPLDIFVPKGYEGAIRALIGFDRAFMGYEIRINAVAEGAVYNGDRFSVEAFRLSHSITSYGYIFAEDDRTHFIKEKAVSLGLRGKMFSELLVKRRMRVGGKLIRLSDVTTKEKGAKLVYVADTRPMAATAKKAAGADLLIHESTYSAELGQLAAERMHSTAADAAKIAKRAKVTRLILFHISARYKNDRKLTSEAKEIFNNSEVAKDGLKVLIGGS